MRMIFMGAVTLLFAGCTMPGGADFVGSPHGYAGRVEGAWYDLSGTPSIIQPGESALHSNYGADGAMADMPSTFSADAAGNVEATGVSAYWMAMAAFCRVAPQAPDCGSPSN